MFLKCSTSIHEITSPAKLTRTFQEMFLNSLRTKFMNWTWTAQERFKYSLRNVKWDKFLRTNLFLKDSWKKFKNSSRTHVLELFKNNSWFLFKNLSRTVLELQLLNSSKKVLEICVLKLYLKCSWTVEEHFRNSFTWTVREHFWNYCSETIQEMFLKFVSFNIS